MKPTNLKEFVAKSILIRMYAQNKQTVELKKIVLHFTCYICKKHWNDLDPFACKCGLRFCRNHDSGWGWNKTGEQICIGCRPQYTSECDVCGDPYLNNFDKAVCSHCISL